MSHPSDLLGAYLDGELNRSEITQLLQHLSGCGKCAGDLERMQRVRSAVRSLPVLELPAGLLGDAEPSVVPLHRNRGLWVGAAAAAVALVVALAALVDADSQCTVCRRPQQPFWRPGVPRSGVRAGQGHGP